MAQKRKRTAVKRKSTKRAKKPKVYIAPYKVIVFCISIITLCMLLLFVTNIMPGNVLKNQKEPVTQFSKNEEKTSQKENNSVAEKTTTKQDTNSATVNTSAKTPATEKVPATVTTTSTQVTSTPAASTATVTSSTASSISKPAASVSVAPEINPKTIQPQPVQPTKDKFNFPKAENSAQLIFVFDDGGQNVNQLKSFLELKFPITIAVLPQLAHSKECAELVRKSGKELMLHQPMQAVNSTVNPGPGAITPAMNESEIISTLFQNITEIGPVAGFNNHEGSAITADADKMEVIMRIASQEGIYFLDSRTNSETKVPYVAREMGYSYYERNIFLDNEKTRENVLAELNKALALANKNGSVIMIGHVWSADFLPEILNEVYPELVQKGYTFTTVSKSKARKQG